MDGGGGGGGGWSGGIQDFSVFEPIRTWFGLGLGGLGTNGWGQGFTIKSSILSSSDICTYFIFYLYLLLSFKIVR